VSAAAAESFYFTCGCFYRQQEMHSLFLYRILIPPKFFRHAFQLYLLILPGQAPSLRSFDCRCELLKLLEQLGRSSCFIPQPVSITETRIEFSILRVARVMLPLSVNFIALLTRFVNTCIILSLSKVTLGRELSRANCSSTPFSSRSRPSCCKHFR